MAPRQRPKPRRRGFWFWLRQAGVVLFLIILGLAAAGFIYQELAVARDRRDFPPPGQMLAVAGHAMHIVCTGTAPPGTPTVILEAGTGLASPAWALVAPAVTAATRVCAYDRAGNGWSEPGPAPRDLRRVADELHTLLGKADIAGPYVLVGHSFGGLYIRAYREAYPADVAGMVLVDASHPNQLTRSAKRSADIATFKNVLRVAPLLARFGITRFFGLADSEPFDLPARELAEMNAFGALPEQAAAMLAELSELPTAAGVLDTAPGLGALPLYVLTAGKEADPDWPELQSELATLSSNTVHRTVDASHVSLLFTRAGADIVSHAILAVVEAARTAAPLKD